ncbi:16S rRNA (guanine(966)-N(2))-methyltransferase RsmD [Noviherbaspirillum sp.]|jgi:16S rRNA (guanine(966)-N(2))-methyltransferase RsmD|uniref:16S rRNA (guanine(966)-N(2))-methyltransferase RsmD n=1 Tax=Noviherbaspirillum sp. TaxID=1926288 RepID=UPI0025FCA1C9|nr:16S rRNA (guanine(966)-N(2))-methyltransferase RsmD [Noviherbaspirillum sp.]
MQKMRQLKAGSSARPGRPARQVRIIGGQWKRTPLRVLEAEGLRPTPDRVRETVFNWLNHLLDGNWQDVHCLDLFAGTGALGFEAASRGAARIVLVEDNAGAIRQLEANRDKLNAEQVRILRGDALSVATRLAASAGDDGMRFHIIFLDPPYHLDWLSKMLPLCARLLAPGGLVYAEAEMPLDPEKPQAWLEGWEVIRADKAGMVFYHLLQRKISTDFEA